MNVATCNVKKMTGRILGLDHMLSQKKIYHAWVKHFNYPVSQLESQAKKNFQTVQKLSGIAKSDIQAMIKKHSFIVVGDDSSVGIQQTEFVRSILPPLQNKKVLIVTNRDHPSMFSLFREMKFSLKKISYKKFSDENSEMEQISTQALKKFDHVVVWTGHLRLSSKKFQRKMKTNGALFVYLQLNELQWRFPKARGWKKINSNQMVWMDSSPLISIDQYRSSDELDAVLVNPENLIFTFKLIAKKLSKILLQKTKIKPKKILHVFDEKNFQEIQKIKPGSLKKFIEERAMRGESAVIPQKKIILLSTLNPSHLAEEVAHYLRTVDQKTNAYGKNMTIVEEALAFFASTLLFPNRKIPMAGTLNQWDKVHIQGYKLGIKLLKMWKKSSKNRSFIRTLWHLYPKNEFEAEMMLDMMRKAT